MAWPRKIFIESTALFQLGPRLETVDLAKLLEISADLQIGLYASEVTWQEYLRARKEEVRACLNRIRQSKVDLGKYGQTIEELAVAEGKVHAFFQDLEAHFSERAKQLGLSILSLPPVDVKRLLTMSIDCVPPFERSNEKGFRDSLIMFTILETLRGRPQDLALLITGDELLAEGCNRLVDEYQTHLRVVKTIEDALQLIGNEMLDLYRQRLHRESEEAKAELLKYSKQISAMVQEIRELSEEDLGQGFAAIFGGGSRENVQQVLSLAFGDVESALWKDQDKPVSRILFKIRCNAKVVVSEPIFPSYYRYPRYTVGGGVTIGTHVGTGKTTEKVLPVRFYGEVQLVRTNEKWELVGLKVDRRPPEMGDLVTLYQIEHKPPGYS